MHNNPFSSFWMAGFECTDKMNAFGSRVDFYELTGHRKQLEADYERLAPFSISTVREGIRWSQIERRAYQYDWAPVIHMMRVGKRKGIQQIWDICHFGFPDDLSPLHPMFARRFSAVCKSFVEIFRMEQPDDPLIVTPINEVSFLSWLGGDARGTVPYCIGQGWEVKYMLMRAYIEGINAMREVDPEVRILTTEPLVNMVPPKCASVWDTCTAAAYHENQFQMLEILSGRICPELGGTPDNLDLLGFNYYYNNQWIINTSEFLPWANLEPDPRWLPLRDLLTDVYQRYQRPIVLTETSHSGEHRPNWIEFISKECAELIADDIPLSGICLYPIIDRPDWDNLHQWHGSGLWDATVHPDGHIERVLNKEYAEELKIAAQRIEDAGIRHKVLPMDADLKMPQDARKTGNDLVA
jgi:beta-glucosidase/6-phospho-beta-glucosidase/beta-galactosidase